jgi:hypothetical protein
VCAGQDARAREGGALLKLDDDGSVVCFGGDDRGRERAVLSSTPRR